MSYEDLDVWKRACRLSCEVYTVLSRCRDFGFRDQITRSSLSIPSNIAEGFERGSEKEKRQFLYYAKGSLAELKTQVYIGQRIGYIHNDRASSWRQELDEIQKMLGGLIKVTERRV
ncbi:four helix bundle protein [uncultured Amphritea sp.]|uniref:four helix bundle protein n=1 Tax=uncultured Amphritea sp. TaxID=981605 RepID=UPI0025ECBA8F|nr:four helix bundle protein [uncultured Amphritea sp.]